MNKYLILQNPGHNRVYYNFAGQLAVSELEIASKQLDISCENIEIIEIENIRYISISCKEELTTSALDILSRLSFIFAIYKLEKINDKDYLIPISKNKYEYIDSKISSLLKYSGKTNELFTKMMVNIALHSSNFNFNDKIHLLDPVSGKGTTLFEGAVYGFDVTGIEIDSKATQEASLFFKKFLETERYKHSTNTRQIYGKTKSEAIYIQEFEYAINKTDFKSDVLRKKFSVVSGNSQDASKYFKKQNFHIIVGDLPYGIAHGNLADKKFASITRNPSELLNLCLPEWYKVLKPGGVVVVAWNSFVVSKRKLEEIFNANNFSVFTNSPYNNFEHFVDKSIKRDIIVAKK